MTDTDWRFMQVLIERKYALTEAHQQAIWKRFFGDLARWTQFFDYRIPPSVIRVTYYHGKELRLYRDQSINFYSITYVPGFLNPQFVNALCELNRDWQPDARYPHIWTRKHICDHCGQSDCPGVRQVAVDDTICQNEPAMDITY